MPPKTRRYAACSTALFVASVFSAASCRVPPAKFVIPPGISASFSPYELRTNRRYQAHFCSVLAEKEFAGDMWKACNDYVDMPKALPPASLEPLSTDFTLLLVGGLGAQCFSPTVVAFKDAAEHLKNIHHVGYHVIEVAAFGSSEDNAETIRKAVGQLSEQRFIAVTHSKGAADFMVGMTKFPDDLKRVEALITVAGAVGGSWLADDFVGLNEKVLKGIVLPSCLANTAKAVAQNGLDSMRRDRRQEFLALVPHNWHGYSISAVSDRNRTSDVLVPLWDRVIPYAKEEDSHIVEREALVPGGQFLGRALGDHWAVAMPFTPNDKVTPRARRFIDKHVQWNRFPRAALLEAAVRVVTEDLK